jgi:hypothetical protein
VTYGADEGNTKGPSLMDLANQGYPLEQAEALAAFGVSRPTSVRRQAWGSG